MKDRYMRGLLAGLAAGIVTDIWDLACYWLKLDQARYLDFAAVIAFEKTASGWMETTLALFIELIFKGLLGVVFVFIIPKISSSFLAIKGILFGIADWFIIYGLIVISKASQFPSVHAPEALSHLISSSIYGLVLALMLARLDRKVN